MITRVISTVPRKAKQVPPNSSFIMGFYSDCGFQQSQPKETKKVHTQQAKGKFFGKGRELH